MEKIIGNSKDGSPFKCKVTYDGDEVTLKFFFWRRDDLRHNFRSYNEDGFNPPLLTRSVAHPEFGSNLIYLPGDNKDRDTEEALWSPAPESYFHKVVESLEMLYDYLSPNSLASNYA